MNKKLVCVGVTILDILGRPIDAIPEAEGTTLIEQIRMTPAGTAAGPAVIGARLGMQSQLVGAVGRDDMGDVLLSLLKARDVDTTLVSRIDDMATSATILAIDKDGGRPNFHAAGASLMMAIDAQARAAIVNADHIHWGGVGLMFSVDNAFAAELLCEAKANGAFITADLIVPGDHTLPALEPILPYLDFFMPSLQEAQQISGQDSAGAAADFFFGLGGTGCVFKMGRDGSYLATKIDRRQVAACAVDAVDTTGCGDSYCAGFHAGVADGMPVEEACRFASATAALVATGLGSDAGVESFELTRQFMHAAN